MASIGSREHVAPPANAKEFAEKGSLQCTVFEAKVAHCNTSMITALVMVDVGCTTRLWVAYDVKATGLTWTLHGAALAESLLKS